MDNRIDLLDVVTTIYSAPGDQAGWTQAVEEISELVGGKASAYLLINKETQFVEVSGFCGFTDQHRAAYEGPNGKTKDIRFQYLHNLLPGQVFRDFEYVPSRAAWDASEWIQYQREELGCYWCMSAQVSTHGLWQDIITINRLEKLGPHTDKEKSDLQTLLPHLARAAELQRMLTSLESRFGAVLSVLDRLLIGVAIIDRSHRVALANVSAQQICESSGTARLMRDGRFMASDSSQDQQLQQLIADAIATSKSQGLSDGGQTLLTQGTSQVLAEVIPLRDDNLPDGDNIRGAAVFLLDQNLSQEVSLGGLAKIFGLSPAEEDVANTLSNGLSVKEVADRRNSSEETVRKQLKSVFAKTGVNSQLELVRLATKVTPPIKR